MKKNPLRSRNKTNTNIRPNKPLYYILEESNFNLKYARLCDLDIRKEKKAKLFANSGDLDQTPLFGGLLTKMSSINRTRIWLFKN